MSLLTSQREISSIVNEDIQAKINFFYVNSWDLTHSKQLANNNNNIIIVILHQLRKESPTYFAKQQLFFNHRYKDLDLALAGHTLA